MGDPEPNANPEPGAIDGPDADAGPDVPELEPAPHTPLVGLKHRDLQTIVHLEALGGDVRVPRHLIFYLYFSEKSGAKASARALRHHGFSVGVHEPWEKIPKWAVIAERRDRALLPVFLHETTLLCERLATRHNGEYDGWEAGITEEEKEARRPRGFA